MVHVEGKRMDSQQTAQSLVDKASLRASALHNPERRGDTEVTRSVGTPPYTCTCRLMYNCYAVTETNENAKVHLGRGGGAG